VKSFDRIVEELIQKAQERGDFDNLPGKGKPIDLSAYFETPEEVRVAQSVLKNAGFKSREADLLKFGRNRSSLACGWKCRSGLGSNWREPNQVSAYQDADA
jgi:hypothetical protein